MKAPLLKDDGELRVRCSKAAWQYENAVHYRLLKDYPKDIVAARDHYIKLVRFDKIYYLAMICLVILTFMEVPAWCHEASGENDIWRWMPGSEWCRAPSENADLNLSGAWYIPPGYALIFEILIEIVIFRKFYLMHKLADAHFDEIEYEYYPKTVTRAGFILAIGSILDTAAFLIFRYPFRLTFIFRTGLLFLLPSIQHLFYNVFTPKLVTEFLSVATFLIGTMIFFAWIAVTLFQDASTVAYIAEGEEVLTNKGLDSFGAASYTMFVSAVTSEWTDCFMPSFVSNRSSGIMWLLFLVLCQILLKNIVLDTLVSAYLSGWKVEQEEMANSTAGGFLDAFSTLSAGSSEISKGDFVAFARTLGESPWMRPVPTKVAELLYDKHAPLVKTNFIDVCRVLNGSLKITHVNSALADSSSVSCLAPGGWLYEKVSKPEDMPAFDVFMNKVLIVNMLSVVVESVYDLNNIPEPAFFDYMELTFSLVYLGEVLVKLSVKSWAEYWNFAANKFDFFCTWLLLITSFLPYLNIPGLQADLAHYANILRLLRLLRIVKQLKQYPRVQFMIVTITRIFYACSEIFSLLFLSVFFFANFGVNFFGGKLYEGNEALEKSEYEEKHWFAFNFNDMFMAFSLWINQLLIEYAPVYTDALYRVAAHPDLAWWIFPAFYFICSAIMFELLSAFTVQVFIETKKEWYGEDENEEEEGEHGAHDAHGAHGDSHGHGGHGGHEGHGGHGAHEGHGDCCGGHGEHGHGGHSGHGGHGEHGGHGGHEGHGSHESHGGHGGHGEEHGHGEHEEHAPIAETFLDGLQPVFEKKGMVLHYSASSDAAFQREVKEEFEELAHGSAGVSQTSVQDVDITRAAWQLENVKQERDISSFPVHLIETQNERLRVLQATKWYNLAIVGLVVLTLVEVPAWCHQNGTKKDIWTWRPGSEWCTAPTNDGSKGDLFLSGIWYLPPGYALIASIIVEVIILRKFVLEYFLQRDYFQPCGLEYKSMRLIKCGCLFAIGGILDTALFALIHQSIRFTFIFRTGLLLLLPGPQRLFFRIFNRTMLGEWASIAVFFVGNTLFFAWIVVTLFQNKDLANMVAWTSEEEEILANHGFETFRASIYTMFLAGTTEGFTDIFMPSFVVSRWFGLLWFAYLLIAQVLLLNLVIDAFVAAYMTGSEELEEKLCESQAHQIHSAFQDLSGGGAHVRKDVFLRFVDEYGKSPLVQPVSREIAEAIYDKTGNMTKEAFCDACIVLQRKLWLAPADSIVASCSPSTWRSGAFQKLHHIVWYPQQQPAFDEFMNWVLTTNLVLILVQSAYDLNKWSKPSWMHVLSVCFTLAYVVEVVVKLLVKSFAEYWSFGANRFDFLTTWLLLGTTLIKYVPSAAVHGNLAHYANILRLLRLVRVVKQLKRYPRVQFMVMVIGRMVQASGDILVLLGTMMFFFVTFSVNFFGGLFYKGNPQLEGLDYEKKYWFVFNYNDSIMAFTTWYTNLLQEYMPEMAEALQKVVPGGWGDYAWYIYPVFYVIGVSILFEVLVAFTVETFLALKEQYDGEEEEEDEEAEEKKAKEAKLKQAQIIDHLQQRLADDGERLHYSITGTSDTVKRLVIAYEELLEKGTH